MEFWGVEVKAGQPLTVEPVDGKVVHLSQACLGETKKGADQGLIYVKVGDQKLVLGNISSEKFPQLSFDLVFEKEFELSHNLKSGSVHFAGYQSFVGPVPSATDEEDSEFDSDSDEGEDLPMGFPAGNGIPNAVEKKPAPSKANSGKPETSGKQKVKIEEPSKDDEDSSDDDSDDVSDDGLGSGSSDEDMPQFDSDDEDASSDEEDEETPTPKKNANKKRANESASKTPVPAKKQKQVTPQKTGGKKEVHTATPHPAKKGGKTPATGDKAKAQTPKSASEITCKSCSKSFNSDGALQSHNKAKHSAAK